MKLEGYKQFIIENSLRYFRWIFLCFILILLCYFIADSCGSDIDASINRYTPIHDIPAIITNSASTYDLKYFGANYIEPYPRENTTLMAYRLIMHSKAMAIIFTLNFAVIEMTLLFWFLYDGHEIDFSQMIRGKQIEAIG